MNFFKFGVLNKPKLMLLLVPSNLSKIKILIDKLFQLLMPENSIRISFLNSLEKVLSGISLNM